jgi:bifunctional non-homologous end joining protein LigD
MAARKKDGSPPSERLAKYREIRDFGASPEPSGDDAAEGPRSLAPGDTRSGSFVVHMHSATAKHYDLRIERGGVLLSFAVPHGPTLDPERKVLAIETEDHPLEYVDYEGIIPEGNYGAGPMICWDRGEIRYLESSAEQGHDDGKLDFVLHGYKLRGRFALVRLKKSDSGKEWLLIKKKDAFATSETDVKETHPLSVLSGLAIDELARAHAIAHGAEVLAEELGATAGEVNGTKLVPMLCGTSEDGGIPDEGYVFELKLDGVRVIADKRGSDVALTYRSGRDTTDAYPEVAVALRALAAERVVLDGEIVAFDESGAPSFQRLLTRVHRTERTMVLRGVQHVPIFFVVFDVLALGKWDLRKLPWEARRKILGELVRGNGIVRPLDYLEGHGRELLEFCRARHLEGIVAKRRTAPYREGPKRTDDWLKIKTERDESFVVVGYTKGKGRTRLGALDLATYDGETLVARGKVGSGLDEAMVDLLLAKLQPLVTKEKPYVGDPGDAPLGRTFVKPELVVTVRFLGWSDEGSLRFPVFRGIDVDRGPKDCTVAPHGNEPAPESEAAPRSVSAPKKRVSLTNQTKVFWPKEGLTKGDLCRYYERIGPTMLPFLRDRPVVLVRYPDGIEGKSFYQWNVPFGFPSWIRHVALDDSESEGKKKRVFLINDLDALLAVANLGAIPIHVLACRELALDRCDFCTLDFDVERSTLANGITLARTLRELLATLGLVGFVKTSGQLGLHVLVPLGPGVTFETAQALNVLLGRLVTERHKDIATLELSIEKRGARVFVDIGQTGRRRTIVAPYSVRAFPGARVSTPVRWEELDDLDPGRFTIGTVPDRAAESGDPMADLLLQTPDIPRAIERLAPLIRG